MSSFATHVLVAVLSAAAPVPFADGGVTLHEDPKPRFSVGAEWFPFGLKTGQGLPAVGGRSYALGTLSKPGNAGLALSACYGRPDDGLWLSFEAGMALLLTWGEAGEPVVPLLSPVASMRLGYAHVSIRVAGFITHRARLLAKDYYGLTLEGRWWK